jgi:hypothetical protein
VRACVHACVLVCGQVSYLVETGSCVHSMYTWACFHLCIYPHIITRTRTLSFPLTHVCIM